MLRRATSIATAATGPRRCQGSVNAATTAFAFGTSSGTGLLCSRRVRRLQSVLCVAPTPSEGPYIIRSSSQQQRNHHGDHYLPTIPSGPCHPFCGGNAMTTILPTRPRQPRNQPLQSQQRRHKSVFVSKHNQSLHVTAQDILDALPSGHQNAHRITSQHVIFEECPFCNKPTRSKPDNQYKLYVSLQNGAYFCHRCGTGGSWFDFRHRLGAPSGAQMARDSTPSPTTSAADLSAGGDRSYSAATKTNGEPQPLPLPNPNLKKLYIAALLDDPHGDPASQRALDYLKNQRGLQSKTLHKYGVGLAKYKFPDPQTKQYISADCITFPWIMPRACWAEQEQLRGVRVVDHATGSKHANSDCDFSSSPFITRRIKARALEHKSWQRLDPPGGGWGFFGYHTIPEECKEVVLTEGEYDAMAVWQATGRPAISLPNGCRSLPVEALPLLEKFDRILLWMDNDGPGQEGAELFAKKIGLGRCYIVKPTEGNTDINVDSLPKDANEALLQGLDLERIIKDAKLTPHERILHFNDLRDEVMDEILYPEKYVGTPMTSLPLFNNLIQGLRRGEMTVLTGPTGSGKTTFLGQLTIDLAEQGINVLWGSFEIRNTRLLHKLMHQHARKPLKQDPQELQAIADGFSTLPLHFMKFHGGSDVDDVLEAMEYAVYVHDCQHIVLDNLQFMISRQANSNSSFDKFDAQDIAIEKFRKFATERNVHVTLVVHPRKEDESAKLSISSIYGSAKATQEADIVLILQHEHNKKYIDIRKNRFSGTLGQTPLFFDRKSCRYTEQQQIGIGGSGSSSNSASSTTSTGGSGSTSPSSGGEGGSGGFKPKIPTYKVATSNQGANSFGQGWEAVMSKIPENIHDV